MSAAGGGAGATFEVLNSSCLHGSTPLKTTANGIAFEQMPVLHACIHKTQSFRIHWPLIFVERLAALLLALHSTNGTRYLLRLHFQSRGKYALALASPLSARCVLDTVSQRLA